MDQYRPALRDRIAKIRKENRLKQEARQRAIELKNQQELARLQETRLTGDLSWIEVTTVRRVPTERAAKPGIDSIKVIGVKDGDTIEVIDPNFQTHTVRLAHIDCPEKGQAFGTAAKKFTADFRFGQQITITRTNTDRYGRAICEIFVEGKSLNLALVENGLASHFKKYSSDPRFTNAENAARAAKIGLWSHPNPTPPWEWRRK